ncbi:MAG: DUF4358 domain-containing protein [Clostridia bacterium]|nr:DUF4358 domain-containing protein [Clostridia bacterium]
MNRKIIIILSFCLILFSCAQSPESALEIMQRFFDKGVSLPDGFLYTSRAQESSESYISQSELGALYYENEEVPKELEVIESYAIYISKGTEINELHIFKTKYRSERDTVERMLNRRKKMLLTPEINPNSSEFLCEKVKECEVFSKGNYIFLIAGEDISFAVEICSKIC